MANVLVTIRVMPKSPEVDLSALGEKIKALITSKFSEAGPRTVTQPIGYGLKALMIQFMVPESSGSPDPIAEEISGLEGVESAEVTEVTRELEF